ncbi:MAG TPA: hypothetical protein O0Y13_05145 [Methanocorpusculum sp.]|nr:hypothetical protein [Methanocorpusculum sp.]HJK62657.1 hypothetical protein [Methanocorpusculum sp.]HJK63817.1 hypothetical protein [Methanocorpusculum sp.]HJK68435.1 hypothetical protein [Methanocorpusculum sp.]
MTSKRDTQRAVCRAEHDQHNAAADARPGCGDSGATPARRTDNGTPSDELCEQIRSLFREILKEPEFSGRFRRKKEM